MDDVTSTATLWSTFAVSDACRWMDGSKYANHVINMHAYQSRSNGKYL